MRGRLVKGVVMLVWLESQAHVLVGWFVGKKGTRLLGNSGVWGKNLFCCLKIEKKKSILPCLSYTRTSGALELNLVMADGQKKSCRNCKTAGTRPKNRGPVHPDQRVQGTAREPDRNGSPGPTVPCIRNRNRAVHPAQRFFETSQNQPLCISLYILHTFNYFHSQFISFPTLST